MVGCSLDSQIQKSSALLSQMCINLLWRVLSILLIPITWHRLRSVIWAGSRHSSSIDSLLLKKGQSQLYVQTQGPHQSENGCHYMTSWSLLTPVSLLSCAHVSDPESHPNASIPFQNENLPFHRIFRILQGEKEIRLLSEPHFWYLSHASSELCPWKLCSNDETWFVC